MWKTINTCLTYNSGITLKSTDKILGMDLDWTIIKPLGKAMFIINSEDWVFAFDLSNLRKYINQGYKLVIFTNQSAIGKNGKLSIDDFKQNIESIQKNLKTPIQMYAALEKDIYRKPCPGMWNLMLESNNITSVDPNSLFIGDAAGRPKKQNGHADFSSGDYYFAKNIHLKFKTPEQFFMNSTHPSNYTLPISFIPSVEMTNHSDDFNIKLQSLQAIKQQQIILLVGSPASGKSRLSKIYFNNYQSASQDVDGTLAKTIKNADNYLKNGKSIIIDNCNKNIATRAKWIELSKKYNLDIHCIHVNLSKNLTIHLNKFRSITTTKHIPSIAIHSYYKGFEPPTTTEGFLTVTTLGLDSNVKNDNNNNDNKNLLNMYLCDKYTSSYIIDESN